METLQRIVGYYDKSETSDSVFSELANAADTYQDNELIGRLAGLFLNKYGGGTPASKFSVILPLIENRTDARARINSDPFRYLLEFLLHKTHDLAQVDGRILKYLRERIDDYDFHRNIAFV